MAGPELPDFYFAVAPELTQVRLTDEKAASCGACPMQRVTSGAHGSERVFTAKPRCCTYHPRLANFLVGRALRRGDVGARKVLERLRNPDGVGAYGVAPDRASAELYAERKQEFGRLELTCPYWTEGEFGCSIHRDRNAVCRTWHCKHAEGEAGWAVWMELKAALAIVEDRLGAAAVDAGSPPAPGADRDEWIAWYLWCADWVDRLSPGTMRAMRDEALTTALAGLREKVARRDAPMPDVLGPELQSWKVSGDVVRMTGYSAYDTHDVTRHVFVFLSKLDGVATWWEALQAAEAEVGEKIGADLVRLMWRQGMLTVPPPPPPPGGSGTFTYLPGRAEPPA